MRIHDIEDHTQVGVAGMILLDNEPQERNKYFGKSAGTIAQLVERYSVRLDGGRFMGSGAMMFCSSSPPCVYILTAKHNLTKFAVQEKLGVPAWDDEAAIALLHKRFREKVTIRMGARTAAISNIFYFGSDWTYDVCCLTTSDTGLYGLWRDVDSKLTPLLWWGDTDYDASGRQKDLLRLFAEDPEAQTLSEASKNRLRTGYYLVQTGFGCNSYKAGAKRTQDQDQHRSPGHPQPSPAEPHRLLGRGARLRRRDGRNERLPLHGRRGGVRGRDDRSGRLRRRCLRPREARGQLAARRPEPGREHAPRRGRRHPYPGEGREQRVHRARRACAQPRRRCDVHGAGRKDRRREARDEAFARFWDGREAVGVGEAIEAEGEPLTSG